MTRAALPRRAALAGSLLAALLLTVLATADAGTAFGKAAPATRSTAAPPPAVAALLSCRTSTRIDARTVAVATTMRPVAGSVRLAQRIDLYQRPFGAGRWTLRADVPGLGSWNGPSDPTIGSRQNDVFKFRQGVGRLVVGFSYRFRVGFRWLDGHGKIVHEETHWTGSCRQPDLRPDLAAVRAAVLPSAPDATVARYTLLVRNQGASAARNIAVSAQFAGGQGATSSTRTIARLAPRQSATVTFVGPLCAPGTTATLTVDPAGLIDEVRKSNNAVTLVCPTPTPPTSPAPAP